MVLQAKQEIGVNLDPQVQLDHKDSRVPLALWALLAFRVLLANRDQLDLRVLPDLLDQLALLVMPEHRANLAHLDLKGAQVLQDLLVPVDNKDLLDLKDHLVIVVLLVPTVSQEVLDHKEIRDCQVQQGTQELPVKTEVRVFKVTRGQQVIKVLQELLAVLDHQANKVPENSDFSCTIYSIVRLMNNVFNLAD